MEYNCNLFLIIFITNITFLILKYIETIWNIYLRNAVFFLQVNIKPLAPKRRVLAGVPPQNLAIYPYPNPVGKCLKLYCSITEYYIFNCVFLAIRTTTTNTTCLIGNSGINILNLLLALTSCFFGCELGWSCGDYDNNFD